MNPSSIVDKMMQADLFSQWLGVEILDIKEGYSKIKMLIRKEMVNGFGMLHGGVAFSLADSAFSFASNNRNYISLALDASITLTKPTWPGDVLTAEATELHNGRSTGLYSVTISNQNNEQVALFKGVCFRTGEALLGQQGL